MLRAVYITENQQFKLFSHLPTIFAHIIMKNVNVVSKYLHIKIHVYMYTRIHIYVKIRGKLER